MNLIQKVRFKIKSNCKSVFILGCPRSGTTLAKRYLGTHPQCKIAPYVGLYKHSEKDVMRVYKFLSSKKATVFKQVSWVSNSVNWGENKTAIPFLKTYFPNCYFILMIRNPSATLASLKAIDRHNEVPKDSRFSDWWVELYENALNDLKGQRYIVIRYEDLVQKPFETKNKFCEFLEIEYVNTSNDASYELPENEDFDPNFEDPKCIETNTIHTRSLNRKAEDMEITDRLKKFANKFQYDL